MSDDGKPPKKPYTPGDGIRSMRTSNAFRALNFELYVKPHPILIRLGLLTITSAGFFLAYVNYFDDHPEYYKSMNEDGTFTKREKKSRWDS